MKINSYIASLTVLFSMFVFSFGLRAQDLERGPVINRNYLVSEFLPNFKQQPRVPLDRAAKSVYFYENFEQPTEAGLLPQGWVQKRTTTPSAEPIVDAESPRWFRNSASFGFADPFPYIYSGAASMAIGYTAPDFTWAISPVFYIPDTEGDVNLTYWAWIRSATPAGFSAPVLTNYFVKVKADDQWFTLLSYFGVNGEQNLFEEQIILSMNPFKGKDVQIAFVYEYFGWQMAIDEIFVGEELEEDFGLADLTVFPSFGLLAGDIVNLGFEVFCNGSNSGSVEVSLYVNEELYTSYVTQELFKGGEAEYVIFNWTAPSSGIFSLEIRLPEDQFIGNNYLQEEIYVNQYFKLAEDFENFEFDELGIPNLIFPPHGWSVNDPAWVTATEQWPIFDGVSAMLHGRLGAGSKVLYTQPVNVTSQDEWIRFFLSGVNNSVDVGNTEGANPPGVQGYSTFQLKYAGSVNGPWIDLGDPVEFKRIWHINDQGDTIGSTAPNAIRMVQYDISHLNGNYVFAFTATSNFNLVIGQQVYRSFVIIDNVMIGRDPIDPRQVRFEAEDTQGNPLDNVKIHVYSVAGDHYEFITDPNGFALGTLFPGEYSVKGYKLGYKIFNMDFEVEDLSTRNEVIVNLIFEIPEISYNAVFAVEDQQQNQIKDALISLQEYHFQGLTDSQGILTIPGFVPGLFNYFVTRAGFLLFEGELEIEDQDLLVSVLLFPDNVRVDSYFDPLKLTFFPNPAKDYLFVESDSPILKTQLFDMKGNLIKSEYYSSGSITLNVSDVAQGVYILRVFSHNKTKTLRIIVE